MPGELSFPTPRSAKLHLQHVRWLVASAVALGWLVASPFGAASAHSADMYLQDESIVLTADGVRVDWQITPGPLLAGAVWDAADQNKDNDISPAEARAWVQAQLPAWVVMVDGHALGAAELQSVTWPKTLDVLQAGSEPVEAVFAFHWPSKLSGKHRIVIHSTFQEAISLNWFSVAAESGLSFATPQQANGQLQTDVFFPSLLPGPPALTTWTSGQPNLQGLNNSVSNLAIGLSGAGSAGAANPLAGPAAALSSLVRAQALSPLFLLTACVLSLALGALHALTPGHGKTLVAAYLVGSQGRTRDAVFLGSVVTATHTGSVLLLGLVTLVASRYLMPAAFVPVLEFLSGLLVAGFGVQLLVQRSRALYAWYTAQRAAQRAARHGGDIRAETHGHSHVSPAQAAGHDPAHGHTHPHYHEHGHPDSHELLSDGALPDDDSEGATALAGHPMTWRSLLTLGISGGLVPCPDAIALLLVAVAVNRIPLGMLLIVAFSLGLAAVLIVIGIAMVNGMRFISKSDVASRITVYAPTLSALAVFVLGVGLTVMAASSAFSSSAAGKGLAAAGPPTSTPAPSFDLETARVLYLAQAADQQIQLFVRRVAGGDALQLTHEPAGLSEFALSPDHHTILYDTQGGQGETKLLAIAVDGGSRRQVLDCAQTACRAAVWLPGGDKVVYERTDFQRNSMVAFPSIWQLDLGTGDTRPLFQDQQLASFAPRLSADGQWLSYIATANQTLQVYAASGGQSLALPYSSGVPAAWSPVADAFLCWVQTAQGEVHLNMHDMTTGQQADLSGAANENDYTAAWSPDGQWIAMTRAGLTTTVESGSTILESVWLIRPDGTQPVQLFSEAGGFLEDLQWSPDGRYLLYMRDGDAGTTEIRYLDLQTDQETTVVSDAQQPLLLP